MKTIQQQTQRILNKYGQDGLEIAKKTLNNPKIPSAIKDVSTYFIEETWPNTHHPALMAISCETVNGNPTLTHQLSAAIVLLTGAADIHDDIIDRSKTKGTKQTAYGKFDKELVLLTGDMLLFQGLILLNTACDRFPAITRQAIIDRVEDSFFKIGDSITSERNLRNKPLTAEGYRKVIESKGAVSQACTEIGAIVGQARENELAILGHFGKTLGLLMTIKNEFTDMQDQFELKHRLKNEILPLPVLYALEETSSKEQITSLLKGKLSKSKAEKTAEIAMSTKAVQTLRQEMSTLRICEEKNLGGLENGKKPLKLLLRFSEF